MWDFHKLNKEKEAYCATHGIDESRRDEFVERGSESPLFRYVSNTARCLSCPEVLPQDLHFKKRIATYFAVLYAL